MKVARFCMGPRPHPGEAAESGEPAAAEAGGEAWRGADG